MDPLLDLDALHDGPPFEIDDQAAHLFKHAALGIDDIHGSARFRRHKPLPPIGCYVAAQHLADRYREDR